jgi:hypothetical protein
MNDDPEFSSKDEFEAQWTSARRRAGFVEPHIPAPSRDLFVFPLLVMYTGFFFGPWGSALMAMHTMGWRVPPRMTVAFIGLAGTFWLAIFGLTSVTAYTWDAFTLQMVRTSLNFVLGLILYTWLKRTLRETHAPSQKTLARTLATIAALVGLFFAMGPRLLITLGR